MSIKIRDITDLLNNYRDFIILSLQLFVVILFSVFMNKNNINNYNDVWTTVYSFMGGQYLMSSMLNKPINDLKTLITKFYNKELYFLDEYNIKKYDVPIKIKDIFEKANAYNNKLHYNNTEKDISNYCKALYTLHLIENSVPDINIIDLVSKLDILLSTYSNKDILVKNIIAPYVYNMYNPTNKTSINPVCLVGPPGVGKTRFVKELSKILKACIIPNKIYGSPSLEYEEYYNMYNPYDISKIKNVSIKTMLLENNNNFINFLDEFDKDITAEGSTILKYLSTDKEKVKTKYLDDIEFNHPNILMIMAVNKKFSELCSNKDKEIERTSKNIWEDIVKPLEDRIVYIEFPALNKDLKLKIAKDFVKNQNIDMDEKIITKIVDNNTDDGVRTILKTLQDECNVLKTRLLFKDTLWAQV